MADRDSRSGSTYVTPEIAAFADRTHASHDAALERAFAAPEQHAMPQIQLGVSESKLLTLLMRMIDARKVVEIGTLAGYSALRLVRGMSPAGRLWTLELEPAYAEVARANLAAAGVADRATVVVGPALESLPGLAVHAPFDAVFLDADKQGYPAYARWAHAHLRPGGLLLGDNSYYFGGLLGDEPGALRMREFHAFVAENFESVCIPTPDGMVVARRG